MQAYDLSEDQIKKLISETSNRIFNSQFGSRAYITGEELIDFSPINQINKFILFQIYQEWNLHVNKMTHPYFNFRDKEVQDALQGFQNILSKHIRIEKLEFKSLLDKAVYNTFRLIINPMEVFNNFFFTSKDSTSISYLEKYVNYFADFDFVVSSILSFAKNKNIDTLSKSVFNDKIIKIVEVYEQRVGHTIDSYRGILFHKLTGYEIAPFIQNSNNINSNFHSFQNTPSRNSNLQNRIESIQQVTNHPINEFPHLDIQQDKITRSDIRNENSSSHTFDSKIETKSDYNIEHLVQNVKEKIVHDKVDTLVQNYQQADLEPQKKIIHEEPVRLADKIKHQSNNANQYGSSKNETIFHNLQQSIQNNPAVKKDFMMTIEQIPVYKQFGYIQRVFGGSKDRFTLAIKAINQCENYEQAKSYMETHILNLPDNSGRLNDTEIVEFMDLVKANFYN